VFSFYSTDGASSRHKMVSQNSPFNPSYALVYSLGLFHKIFTSLSILVSGPWMLYHTFCCIYIPIISLQQSLISGIYIVSVIMTCVVQWLRLAFSKGPNKLRVFPPHMRTETEPVSETSCSLVFRIRDGGQGQKKNNKFWVLCTIVRTL
jgi:hypothetical protein